MSILEITRKIKSKIPISGSQFKMAWGILTVSSLCCFILGYYIGKEEGINMKSSAPSVLITVPPEAYISPKANTKSGTASGGIASAPQGALYMASSRGKNYYPISCSAGNKIKMENRVYFSDITQAEAKGYTLAASCK